MSNDVANLGLATTGELLDEIRARIEIDYNMGGGGLGYTTVGGRPHAVAGQAPAYIQQAWDQAGLDQEPAELLRDLRAKIRVIAGSAKRYADYLDYFHEQHGTRPSDDPEVVSGYRRLEEKLRAALDGRTVEV